MPAKEASAAQLRAGLVAGRLREFSRDFAVQGLAWYRFGKVIRGRILVIDGDEWLGRLARARAPGEGLRRPISARTPGAASRRPAIRSRTPSCAASCCRTSTASGWRDGSAPRPVPSRRSRSSSSATLADKDARIQGLQVGRRRAPRATRHERGDRRAGRRARRDGAAFRARGSRASNRRRRWRRRSAAISRTFRSRAS